MISSSKLTELHNYPVKITKPVTTFFSPEVKGELYCDTFLAIIQSTVTLNCIDCADLLARLKMGPKWIFQYLSSEVARGTRQ